MLIKETHGVGAPEARYDADDNIKDYAAKQIFTQREEIKVEMRGHGAMGGGAYASS